MSTNRDNDADEARMSSVGGRGRERGEPVPEEPTMRSVAYMPAPRHGSGEGRTLKFMAPHPVGLKALEPLSKKSTGKSLGGTSGTPFGVKEEWSGVADPSSWDVTADCLQMVPLDFPLERTHREIFSEPGVVAGRISGALKTLSIQADFDSKKAKAKCKTHDLVSFRIRLYAGGEGGQPVVVEIQRRRGSASCFMKSCRAILQAAEGRDMKQRKTPPFAKRPIGDMKCLQVAKPKAECDDSANVSSALDTALSLVRSKHRDSNALGLQNLCFVTDPVQTLPSVALEASREIMIINASCRDEIAAFLRLEPFPDEFDDEGRPPDYVDQLRHLTLRVFSNALSMCAKDGCLESAVNDQNWFTEFLIPSIVEELKDLPNNANNACTAASCVHSLSSCSAVALQLLVENGAVGRLKESYAFGTKRHELLASQAKLCLSSMGELI